MQRSHCQTTHMKERKVKVFTLDDKNPSQIATQTQRSCCRVLAEFSFAMVTPKGPEGFGCPAGRGNSKESFQCFPLHISFLVGFSNFEETSKIFGAKDGLTMLRSFFCSGANFQSYCTVTCRNPIRRLHTYQDTDVSGLGKSSMDPCFP